MTGVVCFFFFYPFIIFFFNRLRAEYENHQPKHLKKRSSFFVLFCFFFPQKVSVRLHRSGLHGRRGKSNTFDYVQASPGPAPLPMVQYRYIYIVALCTVCIDLYIGMYRLPGPGGPCPHRAPPAGAAPQPWGSGWAAGRTRRRGMVRYTRQHRAASSQTWPQPSVGCRWGGESQPASARAAAPYPTGRLLRAAGWRCGGAGGVPRWFPVGSHEGQQVGGSPLGGAALAGPPPAPGARRPAAS